MKQALIVLAATATGAGISYLYHRQMDRRNVAAEESILRLKNLLPPNGGDDGPHLHLVDTEGDPEHRKGSGPPTEEW